MMHRNTSERTQSITVQIDSDLEDIVPVFLEHQKGNNSTILSAMESGDYEVIQGIAHNIKGSGGGYGFDRITEIGQALERAAIDRNHQAVNDLAGVLSDYLGRVEVIYV